MTRKVQSSQLGISIFPFLAVLLCAMGALIVLLVVVNRASRNVAIAAHKEKLKETGTATNAVATKEPSTATIPVATVAATNDDKVLSQELTKVKDAKDEIAFRREHIQKAHAQRAKELQEERQRLSIAEEQYRKLTDQYETLRKVVTDLAKADASTATSRSQLEAELNRSKTDLEASRKKLTDAQIAAQGRKPNFAVVPYDGPNRTNRRPIYIECTADSIIVQPEGIRLSPRDFVGPNGPGNPLASVMRAVREQYIAAAPNPKSPDAEPYPLFLVRPEGIEAYMIAREAMRSYALEVGYQTVDQDWELAYPAADPNVALRANQALNESRQRVDAYLALSGQGGGSGAGAGGSGLGGGGSIAGSGLGGSGSGSGGRRSYNLSKKGGRLIPDDPTQKIASGAPARPGTFAALDEDQGLGGGSAFGGTGSGSGLGNGSGGGIGNGTSGGLPSVGGTQQNPYGALGGYGTGYGTTGGGLGTGSSGLSGAGSNGSGLPGTVGTGLGGAGFNGSGTGGNATGGTNFGTGGNGSAQNGTGTYGGTGTGANGVTGNPSGAYGSAPNGTVANGSGTGAPGTSGSNGFNGSGTAGQQFGTPSGTSGNPSFNSQGGTYANGAQGGAQSGQGYAGSGGPSGPTFNGDPTKRRFGELEQRGTYASSDAGYSDGSYSPGGSSSGGKPPPEKDPKSKREKPKSLASTRGQGWGVSDRTARSNPVSRPLLLKVDGSSLTLPADPATDSVETRMPLDTITERSSNTFITAIEQRIKRWGIAGKLLYWSPELTFEIAPDGEGRFEDIQALLEGSGWTVKRKNPPGQIFVDTKPSATITQQPSTPVTNGTTNPNGAIDPSLGPMIPQAAAPNSGAVSPQRGFYPLAPVRPPQTATQNNSINTPSTTVR